MRIAALDIGGTAIKHGIWNRDSLTCVSQYPSPASSAEELVNTILDILSGMGSLDAVGVSTRGQVDGSGTILYDNGPIADYTGTPLKSLLEQALGIPVLVENDVNAAAWGEACMGSGKGYRDFLCVTCGTGIGGAIVLNGQLYKGANWSAGEFGSMQLFSQKPAWDGFGGAYYENFASASALLRAVQSVCPNIQNGQQLCKRLDDPNLIPIIEHWVMHISLGLGSLIHIFNPALMVLGGGILQEEQLFHRIETCTRSQLMPGFECVTLTQAQLGNRAGMVGAALLAKARLEHETHTPVSAIPPCKQLLGKVR